MQVTLFCYALTDSSPFLMLREIMSECWGIVCAVCEHDNYYRSRLNLNMHLLIHSLAQKQIQYSSNWIK